MHLILDSCCSELIFHDVIPYFVPLCIPTHSVNHPHFDNHYVLNRYFADHSAPIIESLTNSRRNLSLQLNYDFLLTHNPKRTFPNLPPHSIIMVLVIIYLPVTFYDRS